MAARSKRRDLQSFTSRKVNRLLRDFDTQGTLAMANLLGPFLFRDQQTLREGPLLIDPLRLAAEAGIAGHAEYLLR